MAKKCWWFGINSVSECNSIENSPIGYILEVDLEYPAESHAVHNDYPLAPKKFAIPYDMLSDYCQKIADQYGVKKLIPNLGNKTKYVLHITKIFNCTCLKE